MSKTKIKIFNDRIIKIRCYFSPISSSGLCNGVDLTMHPEVPDLFTMRMFNVFTFTDIINRVFDDFSFSQKPKIQIILMDTPDRVKDQIKDVYKIYSREDIIEAKKEVWKTLTSFETDKCELKITTELF